MVSTTNHYHLCNKAIIIPHFLLVSKSIDLSVGLLILLLGLCIPLFIFTQFIHNIEIDSENFYKVHTITKKIVQKIPFSSILNIEIKKIGQAEQLNITTIDRKQFIVGLDIYQEKEEIIKILQSFKSFDKNPITLDIPAYTQDIGQRPLHIIGVALALFALGFIFEKFLIQAWHGSSENMFSWFFISFPVAVFLSYFWIKGERKSNPFGASILTGVVLGGVFSYDFLLLNRWNNELTATHIYYEFTFDEQNSRYQQWTPIGKAKSDIIFHDGYVRVHDVWDGYTNNFQVGKTYKIAVAKGNLNDIFFNKDAFTKAILVEK